MPNPYREVFRAPGTKGFSAAAFVARLPLPMTTIGIVAMLSQTHGEYWIAGAVSAAFALANAVIAPRISRLIDLYGQSRVLPPATLAAFLALLALIYAAHVHAPTWTLFAAAIVSGVMPSMMALVRARWTEIYRDTPQLHTAFAFESVVDEVVYIVGPILAIGLSVSFFPEAGLLASALLLAIGTFFFTIQKATEPKIQPPETTGGSSIIRLGSLRIVVLAFVAMGAIFGTAEVTVVAFSEAAGQKGAASFILAAYAAGSFIVGLVFGALKFTSPLSRRLVFAIALAAVTTLPMPFVGSIWALTLSIFLAGAAISPTFITGMTLIERLVPSSKITEGITWAMTGVGIGMAAGSSLSGWIIDNYGASNGFWVSVGAGVFGLTVVLLGYGLLSGRSSGGQTIGRAAPQNV